MGKTVRSMKYEIRKDDMEVRLMDQIGVQRARKKLEENQYEQNFLENTIMKICILNKNCMCV